MRPPRSVSEYSTLVYRDLPAAEFTAALRAAGLDAGTAAFIAGLDESIARDELFTSSGDLARLTGRPGVPLAEAVREATA